ncbi:glycosyltransferase, partial [Myxococcus fulvus]|uniref:glycosyltransferase n=1 Tax=Myxococcus fulvus TaxID=33 RepID=UPI003B98E85C
VPVLASTSGEIPHTVGDAGRLLPEADDTAWARALSDVLESPELRRELSSRGREWAVRRFSWPVVARAHLDFFEELLERR